MDEITFDTIARDELHHIEECLMEVDPDDVEATYSDGVLTLDLRDGVRVVINSHRAARQIWMAAVATAWHFDFDASTGRWRTGTGAGAGEREPAELRAALTEVLRARVGVSVAF